MLDEPRQALVYVDLRPIRLGYLVRDQSEDDVRQAVLEACSRWGGLQEPLLPVSDSGHLSDDWLPMLDLAPIDYLCAVPGVSQETAAKIANEVNRPLLQWRWVRRGMHALHATHLERPAQLQLLAVGPDDDIVDVVALGAREDADQAQAWSKVANVAPSPGPVHAVGVQFSRYGLVDATGTYCEETKVTGSSGAPVILWVAAPNSLDDALAYWNYRCLLPRSLASVASALARPEIFDDPASLSKVLEGAINSRTYWSEPDVMLFSHTLGPDDLRALAAKLAWPVDNGASVSLHWSTGAVRPADKPFTVAVGNPFALTPKERVVGRRVGTLTYLDRRGTLIRIDSPVPFTRDASGTVRLRVSGPPQFSIPDSPSAARLFDQNANCASGSLEIETHATSLYQLRFAVPTRQEVLAAALGDARIRYQLSDKGLLANGILHRLRDPSVLRDALVLRVIDVLTVHRIAYELKELRKHFPTSDVPTLETLAAGLREVRQTSRSFDQIYSELRRTDATVEAREVGAALGRIVDAELAQLGFKINCRTCGMDSFLEMPSGADPRTCPGCGGRAEYARDDRRQEPVLHYRLNSMVDRASDQGVLGHVVGALALENFQPDELPLSLPGVLVEYDEVPQPTEIDILALVGKELWIGEAKPSQQSFDHDQVRQDLRVAARLKASAYLMISTKPLDLGFVLPIANHAAAAGIRVYVLDSPSGAIRHIAPQLVEDTEDFGSYPDTPNKE